MKYSQFIALVSLGCQNHISNLEKNNNFKNKASRELKALTKAMLDCEVKKFLIFTNPEATLANVEKYIVAESSRRGALSNTDSKIMDQLDAYKQRFKHGVSAFLSKSKFTKKKAIYVEELKAGIR